MLLESKIELIRSFNKSVDVKKKSLYLSLVQKNVISSH